MIDGAQAPRTDYLTVKQIASRIGCSDTNIRTFAKAHGIKAKYLLTLQMYSWETLMSYLQDESLTENQITERRSEAERNATA